MSLKIKELKPMLSGILCTAEKYNEYQYVHGTNIIDSSKTSGQLKEYQKVVALKTSKNSLPIKLQKPKLQVHHLFYENIL